MGRITTFAILGLATVFATDSIISTPQAEACGVKLVIKSNRTPRKRLRAKAPKRVVKNSGDRVARRVRVNRKRNDRVRVAAGTNRQARSASPTPRRPVTGPARTRIKENDADPKPAKVATAPEPDTEPVKAEPEQKTEPEEPKTKIARVDTDADSEAPERKPDPAPANLPEISVEVYFGYNDYSVSSDASSALEEAVQWLRDNPRGKLWVFGYADPAGSAVYNERLSARRARAVQRYLAKQAGVSVKRLRLNPRGERDLAYPEDSPKNRRVVVKTR